MRDLHQWRPAAMRRKADNVKMRAFHF